MSVVCVVLIVMIYWHMIIHVVYLLKIFLANEEKLFSFNRLCHDDVENKI